jgi:hypothetical protein
MKDGDDQLGMFDSLDGLINHALASYTPHEPRPGLERRIAAALVAANNPRAIRWSWKPAWALMAGAALTAVLIFSFVFKPSRPEIAVVLRPVPGGANRSAQATPPLQSPLQNTLNRGIRRSHAAGPIPPQSQFGQPRLTREELLLVRFASREPELMEALAKSKPDLDAPITMPAIPDNPIVIESVEMKPITIAPIQANSLN